MKKASTKNQTQTNVSVGVAVALFLVAGALAFAVLPGEIKKTIFLLFKNMRYLIVQKLLKQFQKKKRVC